MIPLVKFCIEEDVKEAIERVLNSGRYVLGRETELFEREFSSYIGVKYGIAVSSGTASLFLILKALNIGRGNEVIVPAYTFVASFSPILMVGATPRFVDVDYDTMTIDPEKIEKKINPKTKAIIVVHLFGHPADMKPILEIAEKHNLIVIEDCAEAHGARYKGKKVGSFGDVSFFSFYPTKNLTVYGDGGMVLTNNQDIAEKIKLLRQHGQIEKEKYVMLGYNFRLSEIHAAIGRVELKKLDKRNEYRRELASIYHEELNKLVDLPVEKEWAYHVYNIFSIKIRKREEIIKYLREKKIEVGIYYKFPANKYDILPSTIRKERYINATRLSKSSLALPISAHHTPEEIRVVANELKRAIIKIGAK